uniref:Transmembrane protein 247 n=1 Tax=Coturnix japonica TaxID=93934 RepID=A0A8C2TD35_COTJA
MYVPKLNSESHPLLHTSHLLHTYSHSVPEHPWRRFDVGRSPLTFRKDLCLLKTRKCKQGAMRDIPTSYFVSDYTTENTDARSHMAHLDVTGRTSALQSEVSTNVEEQKELCCMQVTAADIELQRMWCNFMLAGQKYELEDSDKQRLHEERMTRIRQQFSQGLQDRLLPPNQTVLFLYSFIFMYIIYIAKDLVFYFFQNHYQFSFAIVFFFILKGIFQD